MTRNRGQASGYDRGGFLKLLGGAGAAGVLGLAGVDAASACAGFDPEREPVTVVGPPDPDNPRRVPIRTRGLETASTPPGTLCAADLVARQDSPIATILSLSLVTTGTSTPAPGFPPLWTPDATVKDATTKVLTGILTPATTRNFGFSVRTVGTVPAGHIADLLAVVRLKPGRTPAELKTSLGLYHAWMVGRFGPGSLAGPGDKYNHQIDYHQVPVE